VLGKSSFTKRIATLVLLAFGLSLGAASAQTESVLYSFCAQTNCTDGANPVAGLVFDQEVNVIVHDSGNLYGTTFVGPPSGFGLVSELKNRLEGATCGRRRCYMPSATEMMVHTRRPASFSARMAIYTALQSCGRRANQDQP
jgi:hypothetical protein